MRDLSFDKKFFNSFLGWRIFRLQEFAVTRQIAKWQNATLSEKAKCVLLKKIRISEHNFGFLSEILIFKPKTRTLTYISILTEVSIFDDNFGCVSKMNFYWLRFLFLTKIFIFDQNFYFWSKFLLFTKISFFFWTKFLFFLNKISFFNKNFYVSPKFKFFTKISIFWPKFLFWQEFLFSTKISMSDQNLNYGLKFLSLSKILGFAKNFSIRRLKLRFLTKKNFSTV